MTGGNTLPKIPRKSSRESGLEKTSESTSFPSLTSSGRNSESFVFSPPRCAQALSQRDEAHMVEVARKKKEREGLEELWKLQVDAEKQFQKAMTQQKLDKERRQHEEDIKQFTEKRNAAHKLVKDQIQNRKQEVETRRAQLKEMQEKDNEKRRKEKEQQDGYTRQIFQAQREADEQFVATIKDNKERDTMERELQMRQRASEMKYKQDEARRLKEEMITRTRQELKEETQKGMEERRLAKDNAIKAKQQRLQEHETKQAKQKKEDMALRKQELAALRAVQEEEDRIRQERKQRAENEKTKRAETKARLDHEKMVRLEFEKIQAQKLKDETEALKQAEAKKAFTEAEAQQKGRDMEARQQSQARERGRRAAAQKAQAEADAEQAQREKLEQIERDEQAKKDKEFEENVRKTKLALERRIKYLEKYGQA